jgi:hypothetical protein
VDVEQLQAELLDLGQNPVQRGLIGQRPGEQGLTSPRFRVQTRKGAEQRVAEEPTDAELVVHRLCRLFHGAKHHRRAGDGASHRSCEALPV